MRRVSVAAVAVSSVALLVGVVATPAASAAPNATCTGALLPGTYQNVTVPTGTVCTIDSSDVILGNVTVGRDASFSDRGASIGGNLQADDAFQIVVVGGSVGGNVNVTATSGPGNLLCPTTVGNDVVVQGSGPGADWLIGICPSVSVVGVGGNLTVQNNAGRIHVELNDVQGNISAHNNVGGGFLLNNDAGGSCQLFNDNPPILGDGNTAGPGHTNTCNRTA